MNSQQPEQLEKRNAELEKELAAKKRELEIESSFERVRAVTRGGTAFIISIPNAK